MAFGEADEEPDTGASAGEEAADQDAFNWGPSSDEAWSEDELAFDWLDEADPGCAHPWYRLDFVEDNQGLGCSQCGRAWLLEDEEDAQDALLVTWQSARLAFEQLQERHDRLAEALSHVLPLRHCRACDAWASEDQLARVGPYAACVTHLGALAAREAGDPDIVDSVAEQLGSYAASQALADHWLVERNIADWSELRVYLGRDDETFSAAAVNVPELIAARLGVSPRSSMSELVGALATALDLPAPLSRPGSVFLLGILAEYHAARGESGDAVVERAFPVHRTHRAVVVIDLCRDDIPEDASFTGDMADDLVRMLAGRAVAVLDGDPSVEPTSAG